MSRNVQETQDSDEASESSSADTVLLPLWAASDDDEADDNALSVIPEKIQNDKVKCADYIRVSLYRNQITFQLRHERGLKKGLIALGRLYFDEPYYFAAFIVVMLDCGVSQNELIKSGIFHHFFVHHYTSLLEAAEGEAQVDDDNTAEFFYQTYELLSLFSSEQRVGYLLAMLSKTYCCVRGTPFNNLNRDSIGYCTLNVLNKIWVHPTKLPEWVRTEDNESVSAHTLPILNKLEFTLSDKNLSTLFQLLNVKLFFAFDFNHSSLHRNAFLQLKTQFPDEIKSFVIEKLLVCDASIGQWRKMISLTAGLFSDMPVREFWTYVSKNDAFMFVLPYNQGLVSQLPFSRIMKKAVSLIARQYIEQAGREHQILNPGADEMIPLRVALYKMISKNPQCTSDFIVDMKVELFERALSCVEVENEAIDALQSLDIRELCIAKMRFFQTFLKDTFQKSSSYQDLLTAWESVLPQVNKLKQFEPAVINGFSYPFNRYALQVFFIESHAMKMPHARFRFPPLFSEIIDSVYFPGNESEIRLQKNACEAELLRKYLGYFSIEKIGIIIIQLLAKRDANGLLKGVRPFLNNRYATIATIEEYFRRLPCDQASDSTSVNRHTLVRPARYYHFEHLLLAVKFIERSLPDAALSCTVLMERLLRVENPSFAIGLSIIAAAARESDLSSTFKKVLEHLSLRVHAGSIDLPQLLVSALSHGHREREEDAHDDGRQPPVARRRR